MTAYSFTEYLAMKEGVLLPDRQPLKGLTRLNPFPTTNAHRGRIRRVRAGKKINPFPATIKAVVPPWLVPKDLSPHHQ